MLYVSGRGANHQDEVGIHILLSVAIQPSNKTSSEMQRLRGLITGNKVGSDGARSSVLSTTPKLFPTGASEFLDNVAY